MAIYINGKEDVRNIYNPFTIGTTSGDLVLGAMGSIQRWQGAMDEVRLYNRALSLEEILLTMEGSSTLSSPPASLIGHWQMEEGSGNRLLDATGNGLDATFGDNTGVTWSPGKVGLGLNIAKRLAFVPHQTSLEIPKAITIAAWVKPNTLHRGTIVSKSAGNGFELWLDIDGFIEFRLNRTNNGSTYRIRSAYNYTSDLGKWIHIAATFDGQTSKVYVNGIETTSRTYALSFGIGTTSGDLVIGALGSIQRLDGSLDDLRIYGEALSAQAIVNLANPGQQAMRVGGSSNEKTTSPMTTSELANVQSGSKFDTKETRNPLVLYPNPVDGIITVKNMWIDEGQVWVRVYDTSGRSFFSREINVQDYELEIDVTHLGLSAGTYLLILQDNQNRENLRFYKK
jgi:hypothetical protein